MVYFDGEYRILLKLVCRLYILCGSNLTINTCLRSYSVNCAKDSSVNAQYEHNHITVHGRSTRSKIVHIFIVSILLKKHLNFLFEKNDMLFLSKIALLEYLSISKIEIWK